MQRGGVIRQQGREEQHDFRPIQARIWEWQWAKHVMAFGEQGQQQDKHSPGWSVISFSSMAVWILNLDLILTKRMSPEVQESMQHRPKPDQMWAPSKTGRIHIDMVYSNGNETGCSIMPQC